MRDFRILSSVIDLYTAARSFPYQIANGLLVFTSGGARHRMSIAMDLDKALVIVRPPLLRPRLQLRIVAAHSREAPARAAAPIRAPRLTRRVGGTQHRLPQVVEAVSHVRRFEVLHVDPRNRHARRGEESSSNRVLLSVLAWWSSFFYLLHVAFFN